MEKVSFMLMALLSLPLGALAQQNTTLIDLNKLTIIMHHLQEDITPTVVMYVPQQSEKNKSTRRFMLSTSLSRPFLIVLSCTFGAAC